MLNISWMKGSGSEAAAYFMGADYYLDENQSVKWQGKYKDTLGLNGDVSERDLKALLSNRHPLGGKLTQRDVKGRRAGMGIVFSAPKSLSVMHALAGDERVREAFDKAVANTMQKVEADASRRVRDKGQEHSIITGNLIYAAFGHRMARPVGGIPEPQMHTHVLMVNATYDKNTAKWYALDGDKIMHDAGYYTAFFRADLANQIQQLGYSIKTSKNNFEIDGIDRKTIEAFSSRHKQLNDAAELYGVTKPETRSRIAAMTREKKNSRYTWEELQQLWIGRLTPDEQRAIRDTYVKSLGYKVRDIPDHSYKYVDKAMGELAHKQTYATDRQLETRVYQIGIGKVTEEGINNHVEHMVEARQFIRQKRDRKLTTRDALLKDIKVKDLWEAGLGKYEKLGRDLYTVKAPKKPHLEALNKLYGSRDRFMSMRGNIGRPAAMNVAKEALGAKAVKALNELPDSNVWFVSKFDDGDLPELLEKAVEQDSRIVFWGDRRASRMEEELGIKPLLLYEERPIKKAASKLKETVLNLIMRSKDAFRELREVEKPEQRSKPTSDPEHGW